MHLVINIYLLTLISIFGVEYTKKLNFTPTFSVNQASQGLNLTTWCSFV